MKKRVFAVSVFTIFLAGCATTNNSQQAINNLQMKVGHLEASARQKDDEISDLRYEVERLNAIIEKKSTQTKKAEGVEGIRKVRDTGPVRINVTEKQVQEALKNAGYYTGTIDGKIGENTKTAIMAFQTDHGLTADGIIGLNTWTQLNSYIE